MRNLVVVLAIVSQQACTTIQPDMIDISTAKKWECVTATVNRAVKSGINFTAVYDETSGNGYFESGGEKIYAKHGFFADKHKWYPPDVVVLVVNGNVTFYESGKHTRHIDARCHEL